MDNKINQGKSIFDYMTYNAHKDTSKPAKCYPFINFQETNDNDQRKIDVENDLLNISRKACKCDKCKYIKKIEK